ncbi:MAG TPA: NUDIX hydrolase [Bacillales bacterium]|nr:NUDIX hydrolase [Bacillales bacterium]
MGYVEDLRAIIGHRPVILVGATVIIEDDVGRILMQKRTEPYGVWGLPGGLMELEESTEQAARREVYEETGLTIGKLELLDVFSGKDFYIKVSNGDEFFVVAVAYITREATGEAKVNDDESLEVDYFQLDELPDNIVHTHQLILERYRTGLKSG